MRVNNTTDIPNQLIAIAVAFCIAEGVEIDEIVVKNKMEGRITGQWGWYFPKDRRVVLIVPREIKHTYSGRTQYAGLPFKMESRSEFLIMIMAHELHHAYQHQVQHEAMGRVNKVRHEVEAECEQIAVLNKWRKMYGDVAAASRQR